MEHTVAALTLKYLAWAKKHRSPRSLEWYAGHLTGFLVHLGENRNMPLVGLKPYHVIEWVDSHEQWGDNYRRGAIVAVQRLCNWAEQMGYVDNTPLKKVAKPPARRRDNHITPEEFAAMLGKLARRDPFRDFFLREAGVAEEFDRRLLVDVDDDVFEVPLDLVRQRINRTPDDHRELLHAHAHSAMLAEWAAYVNLGVFK